MKNFHNVGNSELPDAEGSSGMAPESSVQSHESEVLDHVIDPNLLANGGRVIPEHSNHQVVEDLVIQDRSEANDVWPQPILDQPWWLDYDFDPNSLDMSLFDPMISNELFSQNSAVFDDSQLPPVDSTLPGEEYEKPGLRMSKIPGMRIPLHSSLVHRRIRTVFTSLMKNSELKHISD
jgi:hypothetical protein